MARRQVTLAKISRPRLHDVLARTRLHSLLDEALQRPVTWLCAQPGAGKTTLLVSYLEARKRSGIWYQVDAGDADAASFIYHLRLAAEAVAGGKTAEPLPLLTPEYLQDLRGFAQRFFRVLFARLGADATLVLDNFQEMPESAITHRLVVEALQQVPGGFNVFVLSRVEPPADYAPLLADDAITILDGEQLRLTLPETQAIAARRGVDDDGAAQALHERSHGWAAGLTLLLARTRGREGLADDEDADSLQHVFGYFAQRVFDGTAPEHRRALMQLAFVPLITVPLAEQLTGLADAGRLLDHFYKRHLFTDRRRITAAPAAPAASDAAPGGLAPATPATRHVFQFHALFRTFLQHQARAHGSADELAGLARRAGRLLDAAGEWEQALALFAEAGDWRAYGATMVAHAERLLEQGRRQTVADWLARMPADAREREPWLAYWEGRSLMQAAPDRALQILQRCHQRFADAGAGAGADADAEGDNAAAQLASGAAVVQTLWYARLGWSEVAPWADRLEPLIGRPLRFPTPAMELLSLSALHASLAFCRLQHPALAPMGRRLLGLIDDAGIDWNHRLTAATHLITYFHNAAEHELANQLIAKVDPAVEALPASALNRAFWFVFRAIHDVRQANDDEAAMRFQRAEDLARQEGLAHAEFAAVQFRAYMDVLFHRADDARARVARLERHAARGRPDAEMNFYVVQTLLAQLDGNASAALDHAEHALQAIDKVGAAYFQAVFPALLSSALADAGQAQRALGIVAASRRLSRGSYLEAMDAQLLLEEAYVALVQGDDHTAQARLGQGLALAARDRTRAAYAHRIVARKPVLLTTALEAGIEVDFVRQLIRRWRIPPPPQAPAAWPWTIQLRTLGRFEVLVHGEPLAFGRKAPKKTLALLKAIVARGGSAPESALVDTFWPDEEGDAAARSLGAAVHRLRALLGEGDAVVQQGGQLSLDRSMVWVDAWAFERALAAARDARSPGRESASYDEAADANATQTLALYQGAFLAEDEGETWPVPMRERLRSKFVQAVADHAARLEAAHRYEEAIAFYQRGLDADNVVEPFYQGLMRCYQRLDRLPEAVSAYRRLKQTLSVLLSLPPSAGTEKLYQALRSG